MDVTERAQPVGDLSAWDWRAELRRQDRRIPWLARQTHRSEGAVYGYATGRFAAPRAWLEDVARVLNVEVTDHA